MDGIEVSGNISIDASISSVVTKPDYGMVDALARSELMTQEALNAITGLGVYKFSLYEGPTLILPNVTQIGTCSFYYAYSGKYSLPRCGYFGSNALTGTGLSYKGDPTMVVGTRLSEVPRVGGNLGKVPTNLKVYVPDELLDAYKAVTGWSAIASQIHPVSELPEDDRDLLV